MCGCVGVFRNGGVNMLLIFQKLFDVAWMFSMISSSEFAFMSVCFFDVCTSNYRLSHVSS